MEYTTDIKFEKEGQPNIIFENECLNITRATKLRVQNISKKESDFFETVKIWHELDKEQNTTSYYTIETSVVTPVQKSKKYYIDRINDQEQSITFAWKEY